MVFFPSSFGDIIAAAELALSIYKALSETAGANYDYQCLINELYFFHLALQSVNDVLSKSTTSLDENLVRNIKAEAAFCRKLLEKFWDRIKPFQKSLGGGGGKKLKDSWRKITWSLFKTKEVADFRQKLSQHKQTISIFLSGLGISVTSNYGEANQKALVVLTTTTTEILQVHKQLPRRMEYGLDNAVILHDAFGKPITVTWELCFSPDALHTFLTGYFAKKIGRDYVERREYSISGADGKSIVKREVPRNSDSWESGSYDPSAMEFDPVAWHLVVKKGTVLTMSMENQTCPRCYRTEIGVMQDGEWLECRRCERRFTWDNRTVEVEKAPVPDPSILDFRNIKVVPVTEVKGNVNIIGSTLTSSLDFMDF